MEIRLLTSDDAGEWLRLRIEALQGDPEAFSASLEEYQLLSVEEVRRRLWSSADAFVVGAFDGGCLMGMAGFYREKGPKTAHKGRVWGVYVTPNARSQGVGPEDDADAVGTCRRDPWGCTDSDLGGNHAAGCHEPLPFPGI